MSQDARRAKRAGKVVLQLYREHTAYVAESAERMGVIDRALLRRVTMVRIEVKT